MGAKVELLFDPFDMAAIRVRCRGREMGTAVPLVIGRHVHPKAKPDPTPPPVPKTGIDYLKMIEARHLEEMRRRISYSGLPEDAAFGTESSGDQPHCDEENEEGQP